MTLASGRGGQWRAGSWVADQLCVAASGTVRRIIVHHPQSLDRIMPESALRKLPAPYCGRS